MVFLAALALSAPLSAEVSVLYRSNEAGMLLEPIPFYRADEYTYTMKVEHKSGLDVRHLLENGKEIERLEVTLSDQGQETGESQYDANVLAARRAYGPDGKLLWEETYTEGSLSQRASYQYAGGRISGVRVAAGDGSLLYADVYTLSTAGALRGYVRTFADGSFTTSTFISGGAGLSEERTHGGDLTLVNRFDHLTRLIDSERWSGSDLLFRQEWVYDGDTDTPRSSTENRPKENTVVEREYDSHGRVTTEKVSVNGTQTEQTDHTWDSAGNESLRLRRSADGLEEWRFTYDASGSLTQEQYFKKGSLEKTTVYTSKTERYEDIYADGQLVLRAYYANDTKTKEQVFDGGTLLRERTFP